MCLTIADANVGISCCCSNQKRLAVVVVELGSSGIIVNPTGVKWWYTSAHDL